MTSGKGVGDGSPPTPPDDTTDDVDRLFDAACIRSLAEIARLPAGCDLDRFGKGVRDAARAYIRDTKALSKNKQHREIEMLHRLAARRAYEPLAAALGNISAQARSELGWRQALLADRAPGWRIPAAAELRDPATCERAADGLEALTSEGGRWTDGRKRPSGRRSRTWEPNLYAPSLSRAEPRRDAERTLVMWLQVAAAEAGENVAAEVPLTAHHNEPGPFARMVAKVLQRVHAAGPANAQCLAVDLINQLHRQACR